MMRYRKKKEVEKEVSFTHDSTLTAFPAQYKHPTCWKCCELPENALCSSYTSPKRAWVVHGWVLAGTFSTLAFSSVTT